MISYSTVTLKVSQVNVICVKFVDRPEFGLVHAQLDIEASPIQLSTASFKLYIPM